MCSLTDIDVPAASHPTYHEIERAPSPWWATMTARRVGFESRRGGSYELWAVSLVCCGAQSLRHGAVAGAGGPPTLRTLMEDSEQ